MWTRKTDLEIQTEIKKTRTSLVAPLTLFISPLILSLFGLITTGKNNPNGMPKHFDQYISELPNYLVLSFVLGVLTFIIQYFIIKKELFPSRPASNICMNCFKVQAQNKQETCECGGNLESLSKMKWVEN